MSAIFNVNILTEGAQAAANEDFGMSNYTAREPT